MHGADRSFKTIDSSVGISRDDGGYNIARQMTRYGVANSNPWLVVRVV